MSEQNPTEKGKTPSPEVLAELQALAAQMQARCPHCGRVLPGLNVLTMDLPTPQGAMQWLLPCCPFVGLESMDGKAVDGGEPCGKALAAQFTGYKAPQIARPGGAGWS